MCYIDMLSLKARLGGLGVAFETGLKVWEPPIHCVQRFSCMVEPLTSHDYSLYVQKGNHLRTPGTDWCWMSLA